jgi:hypothetical protein
MSTRLNDLRTEHRVVVLPRLHEDDLSGMLLTRGPAMNSDARTTWAATATPANTSKGPHPPVVESSSGGSGAQESGKCAIFKCARIGRPLITSRPRADPGVYYCHDGDNRRSFGCRFILWSPPRGAWISGRSLATTVVAFLRQGKSDKQD